ncbi:MAG: transcription termination/antitermination protein NusA [Deltaproteobacteria bacterium]|nr:transcription termination/antitermination protein NusA [Deltaproteobacteria bacterium]MBW2128446.1 transcription termination/antitermination protein NusA [Deltaproteobacteria bacterium]
MVTELKRVIDQVSREKGIDREVLIKTLEDAVRAAAKKKMGPNYDLEVNYNEELGEIEVFEFKEVVEKVEDDHLQISLEEAREIDPESEIGDSLGVKMDTDEFGRIAAQSAKQVIMQRLREAERNIVYDDYKDRRGEIIHGIVQRFDKGSIIVNLGRTEAELPPREQIPKEVYRQGDRIRAYILDVKQFSRGPQIILSRTHPNFLSALFENEVPEISEKIVSIVQVAREPGSRAKIAVQSRDSDVDPVGACVGMKGSRVQAVVQELRGEKIDIVPWDPDPAKFICNALAPAEITRVIMDEEDQAMEVVVPDDQLSLAIGKRGQNVRLASKLSGWHLDVTSETNYNRALKEAYDSLLKIDGVGEKTALNLYQAGYRSARDVAAAQISDLMTIQDMDEEKARTIIENANLCLEAEESEGRLEEKQESMEGQGVEAEETVNAEPVADSAAGEGEEPEPETGDKKSESGESAAGMEKEPGVPDAEEVKAADDESPEGE